MNRCLSAISIAIIGHNEKNHLKILLPQVLSWATEVVYVDCESIDGSFDFAEKLGCKTFSRKNNSNLNVNKSFAIENCKSSWVLYLDPDERISDLLKKEIKENIKSTSSSYTAFFIKRKNHYFNRWLKYGSQYPDFQLRLFKKDLASFEQKNVHEKLRVEGRVGKLKESMLHFSFLNISHFLKKFDFYTNVEATYLLRDGVKINFLNSLRFLLLKPLMRFFKRYFLKRGFLDGIPGLFCASFDALNFIVRYFKLWELKTKEKKLPKSKRSFST